MDSTSGLPDVHIFSHTVWSWINDPTKGRLETPRVVVWVEIIWRAQYISCADGNISDIGYELLRRPKGAALWQNWPHYGKTDAIIFLASFPDDLVRTTLHKCIL